MNYPLLLAMFQKIRRCTVLSFFGLLLPLSAQVTSEIVYYETDSSSPQFGRLVYHADEKGSRVVDFSHAGYHSGNRDIPIVPVVKTISPIAGDNRQHILDAIAEVAALPQDENGIRGALLLTAGYYPVSNPIRISASGVVLRGVGQGSDPATNTVIESTYTTQQKSVGVIYFRPFNGTWQEAGTRQAITSEFIPAGNHTLEVEDASIYEIGDHIVIEHPATAEWLESINYGNTREPGPHNGAWISHGWQALSGVLKVEMQGNIVAIEGNQIKLDSPIYHMLDRSLSQATIYRHTGRGLLKEGGIENMRVISGNEGGEDEAHSWNTIYYRNTRNCWARDVTVEGFIKGGFHSRTSTRMTWKDCSAINPVSKIDGGRRYNFEASTGSHDILIEGCFANKGRHCFVSNAHAAVTGIVFNWGAALLYDQVRWTNLNTRNPLGFTNRVSDHAWTGTGYVAWNCTFPSGVGALFNLEHPPIGQNYSFGSRGARVYANNYSLGHAEGTDEGMIIPSLYEAQLAERRAYGVGPDMPSRLRATYYEDGRDRFVSLDWLDVSLDEDSFVIERSADGGENYAQIATVAANEVSFVDRSVRRDRTYDYRISSKNTVGYSATSNPVSVDLSSEPKVVVEKIYHAEYFSEATDTEISRVYPGWTGEGHAHLIDDGSSIKLENIDGGIGGPARITMRYACTVNAKAEISVNDKVLRVFGIPRSYNRLIETLKWDEMEILTDLTPGKNNSITVKSLGPDYRIGFNSLWIDGFEVSVQPAMHAAGDYHRAGATENAFDEDLSTEWIHYSPDGSWLQRGFEAPFELKNYSLASSSHTFSDDPFGWTLQGSNDYGQTWTSLDTQNDFAFSSRNETRSFQVSSPGSYRLYRLEFSRARNTSSARSIRIAEWRFFGDSEISKLAEFRQAYGLNADGSDDREDFSGDAIPNIFYFLHGLGDPTQPYSNPSGEGEQSGLPSLAMDDNGELTFSYSRNLGQTEFEYELLTSGDLDNWKLVEDPENQYQPVRSSVTPVDFDQQIEHYHFSDTPSQTFFRLRRKETDTGGE